MARYSAWVGGLAALVPVLILAASAVAASEPGDDHVEVWSRTVVLADVSSTAGGDVGAALAGLRERGKPDATAALILALRFNRPAAGAIADTLAAITGETRARDWLDWLLWQEGHPEIVPHPSFARLKSIRVGRIRITMLSPCAAGNVEILRSNISLLILTRALPS